MKRAAIKFALILTLLSAAVPAHAVELRVTAKALEHTLHPAALQRRSEPLLHARRRQLRPATSTRRPQGLLQGRSRRRPRQTHAKIGTNVGGKCIGVSLNPEADVSVIPDAEGESIGFRDARIEKLSESRELNFLLTPFLSRKLPSAMKVNAADLLRQLLTKSTATTGYALTLDSLKIHSMIVENDALVVDIDGTIGVDQGHPLR